MTGRIYYIACTETKRLKIGFTNGPVEKRLRALQTASPAPLTLIAVQAGTCHGERELHAKFAAQRVHGEWFEMSESLFEHVCMIVWLQAKRSLLLGEPVEQWVRTGLRTMNDSVGSLPEDLAALAEEG